MTFACLSEEEIFRKFAQAEDKNNMIHVLADLTCSTPKEMGEFLGVRWPFRSVEQLDEGKALELFYAGLSDKEIADACNVCVYCVEKWRKEKKLFRVKLPPFTEEQIGELYAQGMNDTIISEELGVSIGTVRKWRTKKGLPPIMVRRRRKKKA